MHTNIRLYPWFQFFRNLLFWQAIWFLYFQKELSAAEAILLAALYDVATTALEVPSGYLSDRVGRRITLIAAMAFKIAGALLLAFGSTFYVFALAQIMLGASIAFASGTDSSLLYESLVREKRSTEITYHEQRAWRFSFSALAVSAVSGGLLAAIAPMWAFLATAIAAAASLALAYKFQEPPHTHQEAVLPSSTTKRAAEISAITRALSHPTLAWLFVLAAAMYTFSHVPFVFGQPFILEAVKTSNLELDAAVISGAITAAMMFISLATSWFAPALHQKYGTAPVLLTAFAIQIAVITMLAITNHPAAIALLFLRMVPDSLARPYILAHIHPLVESSVRATYLSLQGLCGRLFFAASLFLSSTAASAGALLTYPEIQLILVCYAATGLALLLALARYRSRARFA